MTIPNWQGVYPALLEVAMDMFEELANSIATRLVSPDFSQLIKK